MTVPIALFDNALILVVLLLVRNDYTCRLQKKENQITCLQCGIINMGLLYINKYVLKTKQKITITLNEA